jgi:hypothetical protein
MSYDFPSGTSSLTNSGICPLILFAKFFGTACSNIKTRVCKKNRNKAPVKAIETIQTELPY